MSHELHHFSMGMWVFVLAWLTSVIGSYVGLSCAHRANHAPTRALRMRWTVLASISIGSVGIWLMHFIGMMGFTVPGSSVRYGLAETLVSVVLAGGATWFGLSIVGNDAPWMANAPQWIRLVVGGGVMGCAAAAMHYTGMAAVRVQGELVQDTTFVAASVAIGVAASLVALALSQRVASPLMRVPAALLMACAVVALHYTGMAGVSVIIDPAAPAPSGMTVMSLMFPGFIVGLGVLVVLVILLLAAPSDDDMLREFQIADWSESVDSRGVKSEMS